MEKTITVKNTFDNEYNKYNENDVVLAMQIYKMLRFTDKASESLYDYNYEENCFTVNTNALRDIIESVNPDAIDYYGDDIKIKFMD